MKPQRKSPAILITGALLALHMALGAIGFLREGIELGLIGMLASLFINRSTGLKAMDWTFLLYFIVLFTGIVLREWPQIQDFSGALAQGLLSAMAWGSLLIGRPFTLQFAREETEPVWWENPDFLLVNRILTIVWALTFTLGLITALYPFHPGPKSFWISWVIPGLSTGIAFGLTRFFPPWYIEHIYNPKMQNAARPEVANNSNFKSRSTC